ncbi:MAG: uracil-DNA glycosylase [Candidatus Bathyarchaeota archaeon]|nr:uracil-DNA glycosylase [Candidatus Bathyarchaeota archaeon]
MREISEEISNCRRCGLCDGRRNPVVGEGNLDATVAFIGEAPGRREDETGRPFVGAAGRLLDRLLSNVGLGRGDVYISNVLKCRPPNNRRPRLEEARACAPHLERQLGIIEPRVIAPMGNSAIGYLMRRFGLTPAYIGQIHGRHFEAEAPWGRLTLSPLYHPAAALYNKDLGRVLEEDFESLRLLLGRVGPSTS